MMTPFVIMMITTMIIVVIKRINTCASPRHQYTSQTCISLHKVQCDGYVMVPMMTLDDYLVTIMTSLVIIMIATMTILVIKHINTSSSSRHQYTRQTCISLHKVLCDGYVMVPMMTT